MLKPIIISYKLTTCHLLYLTNSYKPKEILLTIIWRSDPASSSLKDFFNIFYFPLTVKLAKPITYLFSLTLFIFEVESVLVFNST